MNTDKVIKKNNYPLEETIAYMLKNRNLTLSTAESCTGGGIASRITSVPGSSQYYKGGIVAYANEIKISFLEVQTGTLEKYGAVSEETVLEMAKGAMHTFRTDCAIATSGIAGPDGGSIQKPVGTIWMAVAHKNEIITYKQEGDEGRGLNTERAINNALSLLLELLENENITNTQ